MPTLEILLNTPTEHVNETCLPTSFDDAHTFHQSLEEYEPTPLHTLSSLATSLHVQGICVKDESYRFGLNAFKGLGVSYALNEILKQAPQAEYTFVSCTDGNHGKALAWRAQMLGHKAVIFMPKGSENRRVQAIEHYQAKVIVTQMNYDDTVRLAAAYAEEHDYYLVQDTAMPGAAKAANHIVLGYSTMIFEALAQMPVKPTHVFLQAGVGSMAGGVLWYLCNQFPGDLPFIGVIEASSCACIYESVAQNKMISIGGTPYTLMAGLNCGEANSATFPLLKAKCNAFIKCHDEITIQGMVRAKNPLPDDPAFSSGESGAVGLGVVEEVLSNARYYSLREKLRLDENSVILVFNTEGELEDE